MSTITEVTFGSYSTCPACGYEHKTQEPGELLRINCDACGESLLFFGDSRTYEADLKVEPNDEGGVTISIPRCNECGFGPEHSDWCSQKE